MTGKLFDDGERYSALDKTRTESMAACVQKRPFKRVDYP